MTDLSPADQIAARLRSGAAALTEINGQLADLIGKMKTLPLQEACRNYKNLSDSYELLNDVRKLIFEQMEYISRGVIPEMLTEAGVPNITVDYTDGHSYRFGKNQRLSVSMPDKVNGMNWLRENGGAGLIQETVNASSLSSFAKELITKEGKDLPADYFKTSTLIYTSVTKAK